MYLFELEFSPDMCLERKKKHKKAQGDVLSLLKETLMTNYYGKILQVGKGSSLG